MFVVFDESVWKVEHSLYRPGQALRVPDFKTLSTWRWQGCQPYAPAACTLVPQVVQLLDVSLQTSAFSSGSLHARFVVDRVALGQIFLQVRRFSLSVSFYPMLHAHAFIRYWCHVTIATDSIVKWHTWKRFPSALIWRVCSRCQTWSNISVSWCLVAQVLLLVPRFFQRFSVGLISGPPWQCDCKDDSSWLWQYGM